MPGARLTVCPSPGFPAPNLTLSQPEVSEGTNVIVECTAHGGAEVMLSGAPSGLPAPSAQLELNASAEDNRRSFTCSAALKVDGQVLRKNQTRELRVLCEWDCWTATPNLQDPTPKIPWAPVF